MGLNFLKFINGSFNDFSMAYEGYRLLSSFQLFYLLKRQRKRPAVAVMHQGGGNISHHFVDQADIIGGDERIGAVLSCHRAVDAKAFWHIVRFLKMCRDAFFVSLLCFSNSKEVLYEKAVPLFYSR
jgi:hypothetical protein